MTGLQGGHTALEGFGVRAGRDVEWGGPVGPRRRRRGREIEVAVAELADPAGEDRVELASSVGARSGVRPRRGGGEGDDAKKAEEDENDGAHGNVQLRVETVSEEEGGEERRGEMRTSKEGWGTKRMGGGGERRSWVHVASGSVDQCVSLNWSG